MWASNGLFQPLHWLRHALFGTVFVYVLHSMDGTIRIERAARFGGGPFALPYCWRVHAYGVCWRGELLADGTVKNGGYIDYWSPLYPRDFTPEPVREKPLASNG